MAQCRVASVPIVLLRLQRKFIFSSIACLEVTHGAKQRNCEYQGKGPKGFSCVYSQLASNLFLVLIEPSDDHRFSRIVLLSLQTLYFFVHVCRDESKLQLEKASSEA